MRHVRTDWHEVQIRASEKRRAYYAGVMACGSVWVCPVCAAKIQAVRAGELGAGIARWNAKGGVILMATYTVPHTRSEGLHDVLSRFNHAMRLFTAGRVMKRLKEAHKVAGTVKGLEVTWGESNGWHPHAHVLYFIEPGWVRLWGLADDLFRRWESATRRAGFGPVSVGGFKLQDASKARDYINKMGREYRWGAEHELVKSHSKRGAGQRFTPFDFLHAYLHDPQARYAALFREFAGAFHGRHQLVWSNGFKARLLGSEGLDDEQIAQSIGELDPILAYLTLEEWGVIRRHNLQGEVLRVAQELGGEGVLHLLSAFAGQVDMPKA